jgi:hypothetical protein
MAETNQPPANLGRFTAKDKLSMSYEEKADFAWRIACLPRGDGCTEAFNKCRITKSAGVSERTLASMRKVRKEPARKIEAGEFQGITPDLLHATPAPELGTLSWGLAQAMNEGEGNANGKGDDWIMAEARRWAEKLARTLGEKPVEQPGLMALALLAISPVMVKHMLSDPAWFDIRNEVEEDERLSEAEDDGLPLPGELGDF